MIHRKNCVPINFKWEKAYYGPSDGDAVWKMLR